MTAWDGGDPDGAAGLLQGLQRYLRAAASRGRTTTQVGPFFITVDEHSADPFLNYAIPDAAAVPTPGQVRALADAMADRHRVPRLEYLERTAPDVLPALLGAGFAVELRPPAMVTRQPAPVALPAGYALAAPDTEALRRGMLEAQNAAFGGAAAVDAAQLARSTALEAAGGIALALLDPDGQVVGGGVATPHEGLGFTEVAGIAVAAGHRRRGLAAAITAELTRRALAAGAGTAYLTPGDDDAARVYARAGFTGIGHVLHVRRAV